MSRKLWMGLIVVVLVLLALGALGGAGYLWWQNNRLQEWHARGDAEFAKGNWNLARGFYGRYLTKKRDDLDALKRYAEASGNIPEQREAMLRMAAQGYQQYLYYAPGTAEVQNALLAIYEKLRAWPDLEHYAEQFLVDRPDDTGLMYYRALAKARGGNREDAVAAFQDLISRGNARAEAYEELASLLQAQNLPNEAEKVISGAIQAHPNDVKVQLAAVRYYVRTESPAGARRHLAEAERLAPDDPAVMLEGVRAAYQERDYARATELGEKLLAADPKNVEAAILLGHVYALREEPVKAIEALQRLDRLARADNPEAVVLLADLLCSQDRVEESKPLVTEYVESYPNQRPMADYFKGRELLALGQYDQAADILATVSEKMPNFPPAQFFLAFAYIRSEKRELGRTTLESYIRQNPGDKKAAALFAREYGPPMSPEEAQKTAQGLLANDNASALDLVSAARQVAQSSTTAPGENGDVEILRQLLEEALKRDPKLAVGYRALADMLLSSGDVNGAQQVLDRARAAGIDEADLIRSEAGLALARNDVEAARRHFETALTAENVTVRDVVDWAEFFVSKGQRELGEYAFTKGQERLGAESQASLTVGRATVAARYDALDAAEKSVRGAAAQLGEDTELRGQLDSARLELARRLLLESKGGEAVARELIAAVRSANPQEPTALALEAQILLKKDPPDFAGARALLQTVVDEDGKNVVALLGLAEIEYRQGNPLPALRFAEQAASVAPRSIPTALLRAQLYMDLNRHLEAQTALDTVLKQAPENVEALRLSIESCIASDRIPQAQERLAQLDAIVAKDPGVAPVREALQGKLFVAKGNAGEAETLLRKQYEENKDDLNALRNLATALISQNRLADAEVLYKDYTDRHKDSAQAWVDLARLCTVQDDPQAIERASESLTRALLVDPNSVQAIRQMIQVQLRKGNLLEALNWCNRYLEREPDNPDILYQKALLLRQRGSLPDAVQALDKAISLSDQSDYRALRGVIYVDLQDYGKALQDLQEVAGGPKASTAQVDLAMAEAYLATGRNQLAREYYESAQRKVTNDNQRVDPKKLEAIGGRVKALEGTT